MIRYACYTNLATRDFKEKDIYQSTFHAQLQIHDLKKSFL